MTFIVPYKSYAIRYKGQALAECIIILAVLGILFALIPLIGKYQDLNHATLVGSHYAAFDSTFYQKSASTTEQRRRISESVRRQFFSEASTPVRTDLTNDSPSSSRPTLWNQPNGSASLISDIKEVKVRVGLNPKDYDRLSFTPTADGKPFLLSSQLDLPTRGFYTANVITPLHFSSQHSKFYEGFDSLNIKMTRHTSVLIKPWADSSPSNVNTHISNSALIFPAAKLQENGVLKAAKDLTIDGAIKIIERPGNNTPPQLGKLNFWQDVVPADRLRAKEAP